MPKVKYISAPDLGAFIIGNAITKGIKDADIRNLFGVSSTTYSHWKKDLLDNLSFKQLIALCKLCGITKREFISFVPLPEAKD